MDGPHNNNKMVGLLTGLNRPSGNDVSGATTPGADWRDANGLINTSEPDKGAQHRQHTFSYWKHLPYDVEMDLERRRNLDEILARLYIAVEAGDFAPGALHWTRELRSWLGLKFDLPKDTRIKIAKLYYVLSLAPGIDPISCERFASMFMIITK